jgi:hypothetical protein
VRDDPSANVLVKGTERHSAAPDERLHPDLGAGGRGFKSPLPDSLTSLDLFPRADRVHVSGDHSSIVSHAEAAETTTRVSRSAIAAAGWPWKSRVVGQPPQPLNTVMDDILTTVDAP